MHLSNKPSEEVSKSPLSGIRSLITAVALSIASSCAPITNAPQTMDYPVQKSEMSEGGIDDPVFIALVSVSAGLKSELEYNPNSRSIEYIVNTVNQQLKEMGIHEKVSARLVGAQETGRGCTYAVLECDGQEAVYISTKNATTALEITQGIQDAYITHIEKETRRILGDTPATKEKLEGILQGEAHGFKQHRMSGHVTEDSRNSWTISFEAEVQ